MSEKKPWEYSIDRIFLPGKEIDDFLDPDRRGDFFSGFLNLFKDENSTIRKQYILDLNKYRFKESEERGFISHIAPNSYTEAMIAFLNQDGIATDDIYRFNYNQGFDIIRKNKGAERYNLRIMKCFYEQIKTELDRVCFQKLRDTGELQCPDNGQNQGTYALYYEGLYHGFHDGLLELLREKGRHHDLQNLYFLSKSPNHGHKDPVKADLIDIVVSEALQFSLDENNDDLHFAVKLYRSWVDWDNHGGEEGQNFLRTHKELFENGLTIEKLIKALKVAVTENNPEFCDDCLYILRKKIERATESQTDFSFGSLIDTGLFIKAFKTMKAKENFSGLDADLLNIHIQCFFPEEESQKQINALLHSDSGDVGKTPAPT